MKVIRQTMIKLWVLEIYNHCANMGASNWLNRHCHWDEEMDNFSMWSKTENDKTFSFSKCMTREGLLFFRGPFNNFMLLYLWPCLLSISLLLAEDLSNLNAPSYCVPTLRWLTCHFFCIISYNCFPSSDPFMNLLLSNCTKQW